MSRQERLDTAPGVFHGLRIAKESECPNLLWTLMLGGREGTL